MGEDGRKRRGVVWVEGWRAGGRIGDVGKKGTRRAGEGGRGRGGNERVKKRREEDEG